jgi:hypothetical protein
MLHIAERPHQILESKALLGLDLPQAGLLAQAK